MNCHTSLSAKRLESEYRELGSYSKLAKKYGVNVRYVWELLTLGKMPKSKKVRNKLGIIPPSLVHTRTRTKKLNEIARSLGYASWCKFCTHLLQEYDKCQKIKT